MKKNELMSYQRPEAVVVLLEAEHPVLTASYGSDTETLNEVDFNYE